MFSVFLNLARLLAETFPFLRPLIGRISDKLMGVERSIPRGENQPIRIGVYLHRVIKIILMLAMLAAVLSFAFWLRQSKTKVAGQPSSATYDAQVDSFEEVLNRSNIGQLSDLHQQMLDDPMLTVPERIKLLERRNKVANRLMTMTEGDEKDGWIANFVDTGVQREFIFFVKKIDNPDALTNLKTHIDQFDANSSEVVQRRLQFAKLVNNYMTYGKKENLKPEFLEQYQMIFDAKTDRASDIRMLYDVAQNALETKGDNRLLKRFVKSLESNPKAVNLSKLAAATLIEPTPDAVVLTDDSANRSENSQTNPKELTKSVEAVRTNAEFNQILRNVNSFLVVGKSKEANDVLNVLDSNLATMGLSPESNVELQAELQRYRQRLQLFEKPFSLEGVVTLDRKAASFRFPDSQLSIILVGNTKSRPATVGLINELIRITGRQAVRNNYNVSLLIHDVGGQERGLKALAQMSERLRYIDFWYVSDKTESSREFLKTTPLFDAPFFIVLNQNRIPISIGSDVDQLEKIVFEPRQEK